MVFVFFPFFLKFANSLTTSEKAIIYTIFGGAGLIILVLLILIIFRYCKKKNRKQKKHQSHSRKEMEVELVDHNDVLKANLIPPLFFTQGIQDPIHQADLVENIPSIQ